jgi:hypothetical protein
MPEHIHLFVAFPRVGITLPSWVGSLRNVIGKRLLKLGISKPHWQEGFFDHLLRGRESYSQKWNYVRMNQSAPNYAKRQKPGHIRVRLFGCRLTR